MTTTANNPQILNEFYDYLLRILNLYQDLVPILRDQLDHIAGDDIRSLDKSLNTQQALLLQTRNFEQAVSGYQAGLGISGNTLSEMIPHLPESEQFRFYAYLGEFERTIDEVGFYREKCRTLIQTKLYQIDRALAENDLKKNSKVYDVHAESVERPLHSSVFEKKI